MKYIPLFILAILLFATPLLAQWEPDVRLTYNNSPSFTTLKNAWSIASESSGLVHVVWFDYRDADAEIYYKRSTDSGITWGPDFRLTNNWGISVYPSVASNESYVNVVWDDWRSGCSEILFKQSTNSGQTWGPDIRLTYDPNYSENPSIASAGPMVHVVWYDARDGWAIYYKRSTNFGSTWSGDIRLSDNPGSARMPSISISDSMVHVVWDDSRGILYKRSTDYGNSWSNDNQLFLGDDPSIACSGPIVHVVWSGIRYKKSTNSGITWSRDTLIAGNPGGSFNPNVSASGQNVHVVWMDNRQGNSEIYYIHSTNSGTSWTPDIRLTNHLYTSKDASVSNSNTAVHVAWADTFEGNFEIYYKRNPTGNSGIEDNKRVEGPRVQGFKITPNPYTTFASIPGHEAERFSLYDISGRKVGTYPGIRIGMGLKAGVYFLRPEVKDGKPLRIVKLR